MIEFLTTGQIMKTVESTSGSALEGAKRETNFSDLNKFCETVFEKSENVMQPLKDIYVGGVIFRSHALCIFAGSLFGVVEGCRKQPKTHRN